MTITKYPFIIAPEGKEDESVAECSWFKDDDTLTHYVFTIDSLEKLQAMKRIILFLCAIIALCSCEKQSSDKSEIAGTSWQCFYDYVKPNYNTHQSVTVTYSITLLFDKTKTVTCVWRQSDTSIYEGEYSVDVDDSIIFSGKIPFKTAKVVGNSLMVDKGYVFNRVVIEQHNNKYPNTIGCYDMLSFESYYDSWVEEHYRLIIKRL